MQIVRKVQQTARQLAVHSPASCSGSAFQADAAQPPPQLSTATSFVQALVGVRTCELRAFATFQQVQLKL